MDTTMSSVLDLIEEKGETKGRVLCYINCRIRGMSIEEAKSIAELSGDLVKKAEKQYQKKSKK